MSCESCHSENQSESNRDVAIHFAGLKGRDNPIVWGFPKLPVCLNGGFTEFVVPEVELRRRVEGDATQCLSPRSDCGALAVGGIIEAA